jgi:hypothetical protein
LLADGVSDASLISVWAARKVRRHLSDQVVMQRQTYHQRQSPPARGIGQPC